MTLSVMDELEFTTSYECAKCEKLEADLKTAKSEIVDLRNLATAMKTQTAKTGLLLQKFDSAKKVMHLQKQKIDTMDKLNQSLKAEAKAVNEQLKKHLDLQEDPLNAFRVEEKESLLNDIASQNAVINQFMIKTNVLEDEKKALKSEKAELEKKCRGLESRLKTIEGRQKVPTDMEAIVSKLKSEIGVLKRDNTKVKESRESAINNLADKKNKDIMKKLADMTGHQSRMEQKMKEILETVKTSPIKASNGSGFRKPRARTTSRKSTEEDSEKPVKKRGRPFGWRKRPKPSSEQSGDDSDLERIARSKKSFKRPFLQNSREQKEVKKRGRPAGYSPAKKGKKIQKNDNLSNSCSSSDEDVELVGQLEDSFKTGILAKNESVDEPVLVCDPLPSTPSQFNIFNSPVVTAPLQPAQNPLKSPEPRRTLPRVLNVKSIFDLMVSSAELSPLNEKGVNSSTEAPGPVEVKDKVPELIPQPVTSRKTSTASSVIEVTDLSVTSEQPPVIPNVLTAAKDSTPAQKSSVKSPNPPSVEVIFSKVTPDFLPIAIKNERIKTKTEPDAPVFTLKPISSQQARASPVVATLGNLLIPNQKKTPSSHCSATIDVPDIEIVSVLQVEREELASDSQTEDDLPDVSIAEIAPGPSSNVVTKNVYNKDKEFPEPTVSVTSLLTTTKTLKGASNSKSLIEDVKPCNVDTIDYLPLFSDVINSNSSTKDVVVSEDAMVCAFEVDVGGISSSDIDTQSDSAIETDGSVDTRKAKKLARISKMLSTDAIFEKPKTRSTNPEVDMSFAVPKRTRSRKSTSQSYQPEVFTKSLRNRKISFTEESIAQPRLRRSSRASSISDASDSNETSFPKIENRKSSVSYELPATKARSPRKKAKKESIYEVLGPVEPDELLMADTILGSEDRNIVVPNDLIELKKSIDNAKIQKLKTENLPTPQAEEPEPGVSNDTASTDKNTVWFAAEASSQELTMPATNPVISDKEREVKPVAMPTFNWFADKTLDLDLSPVARLRRSSRVSSISDASDSNETSFPKIENRKSSVSYELPVTKAKKESIDEVLGPVEPDELIMADSTLGSEDRNIIVPNDLIELKKSIETAEIQKLKTVNLPTPQAEEPEPGVTNDTASTDKNTVWFAAEASSQEQTMPETNPVICDKEREVKPVAMPTCNWFADKTLDLDLTPMARKLEPSNAAAAVSDDSESSMHVPSETSSNNRKRKKTTGPAHNSISLKQIFDIFLPVETISPLGIPLEADLTIDTSDNELESVADHKPPSAASSIAEETPIVSIDVNLLHSFRSGFVPTLPVDDEPLYKHSYEDYTHLPTNTNIITKHFTTMFRKNLSTSTPNVPYIVETILYNHKNKSLQGVEEKFIRIIRNEIGVRITSPADVPIPPIDVLVEFFFDLFTELKNSGYSYFGPDKFIKQLLRKLFTQIKLMRKYLCEPLQSLIAFAIKLSLKCRDLSYLRSYVINTITLCGFKFVQKLFSDCLTNYNVFALIGKQHLHYNSHKQSAKDVECFYLAGLEFYLRYTPMIKYTPIERLTYLHQFAVENHLINAALDAIVVKEEKGQNYKHLNEQGVICLRLMLKSQGWAWLTSTLLPLVFDKLPVTSEYGICRLNEVIETLVSAEIVSNRADTSIVKEKLVPTLIGLLWTAPTADIKFSLARSLINLSPLDYHAISTALASWSNSVPDHFKHNLQYSYIKGLISDITGRTLASKKSRTFMFDVIQS